MNATLQHIIVAVLFVENGRGNYHFRPQKAEVFPSVPRVRYELLTAIFPTDHWITRFHPFSIFIASCPSVFLNPHVKTPWQFTKSTLLCRCRWCKWDTCFPKKQVNLPKLPHSTQPQRTWQQWPCLQCPKPLLLPSWHPK